MRQALEMALEALELHGQQYPHMVKGYCLDAITAIKEALAQPEQEPFGHVTVRRLSQRFENHHDQFQFYPAGQSPYLDNVDECYALYTTPPQRKPLTENEIKHLWYEACQTNLELTSQLIVHLARNIEAAHNIKE